MSSGRVIAIVGAESTGKTTLAAALHQRLAAEGRRVARVDEVLREFCARHGRTPRIDEQAAIAAEQTRRIEAAARSHDVVVADTTALMIAVYSDYVFGDRSLYEHAEREHARLASFTLLTALDLPWQADGMQRDGPHVREPVDTLVRAALLRSGAAHGVVAGNGEARHEAAHASVRRVLTSADPTPTRWQWCCERCGDAGCERRLLLAR